MAAKGTGITSVPELKLRCIVSEMTDCWRWQGATTKRGVAAVWVNGEVLSGPRAAARLAGLRLFKGWRAWRTCLRPDCVNPAHVATGTMVDWGAWMSLHKRLQDSPRRKVAVQLTWVKKMPERAEQALAILAAPALSGVELERLLGVPRRVVSKIRLGKSWAHLRGPSPFQGLGAR